MQVNFHTVNLKKKHPLQISRGVHDKSKNLFVEIVKDGITAWGESAPGKTEGAQTANEVQLHLMRLVDSGIENLSIYEVYHRSKELKIPACAQAAIDMALWDLNAKKARLKLKDLLENYGQNYSRCPSLRDSLRNTFGLKSIYDYCKSTYFATDDNFCELSMGMSGDYIIAIEEGATMVRIGSLLFG